LSLQGRKGPSWGLALDERRQLSREGLPRARVAYEALIGLTHLGLDKRQEPRLACTKVRPSERLDKLAAELVGLVLSPSTAHGPHRFRPGDFDDESALAGLVFVSIGPRTRVAACGRLT
jgi:hypothetical protein